MFKEHHSNEDQRTKRAITRALARAVSFRQCSSRASDSRRTRMLFFPDQLHTMSNHTKESLEESLTKPRDGKLNKVSVDELTILLYIDTASEILPGPGAYTTNPAPGGIHRRESIMPRGKSWPSRNFNPDRQRFQRNPKNLSECGEKLLN